MNIDKFKEKFGNTEEIIKLENGLKIKIENYQK
jgi:hypothetical protein